MFDRYLEDQKPNWRRRWLSLASLVLHGCAGVGIVAYTFFHVEEIAPPALSLTFFSSAPPPPPPPPPPPGGGNTSPQPKVKKIELKPDVNKLVQPSEIKPPEEKPKEQSPDDEPGGQPGGEKGGVVGGEVGGVVGGEIGGQKGGVIGGTGTGPPGGGGAHKFVPQFVLAASKLEVPPPSVPDWYYNENRGKVTRGTFRLCVAQDGHVSSMEVLSGLAGNMNAHVIEHVKQLWKFKPQPLPVCTQWQFIFELK